MSLVAELQAEALSSGSVLGLLRKALVVASKLSIKEVQAWSRAEIDGYKTTPPDYRRFSSELKSLNPYSGVWMATRIKGEREAAAEWQELLTTVHLFNPMAEIETWLETKGDSICVPLRNEEKIPIDFGLPTKRFIPKTAVSTIPERARSYILNWSLELEEKGILGEAMSFTAREKSLAPTVVTNNFYAPQYQNNGIVGAMGDSALFKSVRRRFGNLFNRSKS